MIASLHDTFESELTQEKMEGRLNQFVQYDFNPVARIAPLVVKDFVMRIGYDLSASKETAAISNVGKIDMPPELREYIRLFDVFVSFTAPFVSTDIQKNFFRFLTGMGIPVEITSNVPFGAGEGDRK